MPQADASFSFSPDAHPPVPSLWASRTQEYALFRPSYPREAVQAVLDGLPDRPVVADVGSGTGILSRLLARQGAHVIGIEPGSAMRLAALEQERQRPLAIDYRDASAEATGLDAGSVDTVTCAQSFHWFDQPRALAEFHRILRPAGRLALLWNVREPGDPAADWFERNVRRAQEQAEQGGRVVRRERTADPARTGHFNRVRVLRFPNDAVYTVEALIGRARSASYWPDAGPLRDELEADLHALFEAHQHKGVVTLAQSCDVTLADRVESPALADHRRSPGA